LKVTASLTKKFGVRQQAVFRATPLLKHECGGKAARKSGAATRAQRGSCLQDEYRATLLLAGLRATAWSQQERLTRDIRPATCGWNSP